MPSQAVIVQRFDEERERRGCGVTAVACGVVLAALELSNVPQVLGPVLLDRITS